MDGPSALIPDALHIGLGRDISPGGGTTGALVAGWTVHPRTSAPAGVRALFHSLTSLCLLPTRRTRVLLCVTIIGVGDFLSREPGRMLRR